jgi:hypothetical protein
MIHRVWTPGPSVLSALWDAVPRVGLNVFRPCLTIYPLVGLEEFVGIVSFGASGHRALTHLAVNTQPEGRH